MRALALAAVFLMRLTSADAFDLQGHRGARGLAPENTLEGFATALKIGVTTLELDLGVTKDGVVVVSHDRVLNPDHTRGPDGAFLNVPGPAIRALTLAELKQYDVGRLKPGTAYAAAFPQQRAVDGARIPALSEVFALAKRLGANDVRFNIETKLTPTSSAETPAPEAFAAAVAAVVRDSGMAARDHGSILRLAHTIVARAYCAGDRALLPERRNAARQHAPTRAARPVALDRRPRYR